MLALLLLQIQRGKKRNKKEKLLKIFERNFCLFHFPIVLQWKMKETISQFSKLDLLWRCGVKSAFFVSVSITAHNVQSTHRVSITAHNVQSTL